MDQSGKGSCGRSVVQRSSPLIVLAAGRPFKLGYLEAVKELSAFHEIWVHQLQAQLAELSTRERRVNVENTSPAIDPDAVLGAVHEVGMGMREVEKRADQEGNWNVFWNLGRITLGQARLRTVSICSRPV